MRKYTNTEELANRIIEELSKLKEPIIFKGAMTLLYLTRSNPTIVTRSTKDIDGDYTDVEVTMDKLLTVMTKAVKGLEPSLEVQATRNFSEKTSAEFTISRENTTLLSIDLSVRKNPFYRIYLSFNDVPIQGASENKILADKIFAISTKYVFRRVKDLVDLYILSFSRVEFSTKEVFEINTKLSRKFGDFSQFKNSIEEIQHAYEKLRGVENKPDFNTLYHRVAKFIEPFMNNNNSELIWKDNNWKHSNLSSSFDF